MNNITDKNISNDEIFQEVYLSSIVEIYDKLKVYDSQLFHFTKSQNINGIVGRNGKCKFLLSEINNFIDKKEGNNLINYYYSALNQLFEEQVINDEEKNHLNQLIIRLSTKQDNNYKVNKTSPGFSSIYRQGKGIRTGSRSETCFLCQ